MLRLAWFPLVCLCALSCEKKSATDSAAKSQPAPSGSSASDSSAPQAPSGGTPSVADKSRATTILNAQIAAIKSQQDASLVDTFSADAVVLVPDPRAAHGQTTGLREAIARLSPHDTLTRVDLGKVVAGSSASAVWWSAEIVIGADSHEPESTPHSTTTTIRLTELATADAGWKVVAAAFGKVRAPEAAGDPDPIDASSTTAAGPLTPLSADPTKLDAALAPQSVVFGTDKGEGAFDVASAHTLLHGWTKLALSINGKSREVTGKDWGFAITAVDWQQPKEKVPARMSALVIGTKTDASSWQVVAVQYTAD